ncbi:hypothetical protein [Reyranella sp.]|uniref:DUF7508 domain-containing protein n=1 Tax=Reyranella sp. TaxID=1929291 RepID=UPI00120BD4BD|nr:hypothetical protein [Reyranella sp.]TAJ84005.1 MAG: hypothetical protein EPO50_20760 [Reyranella sp.]
MSIRLRLDKPWRPLVAEEIARLPGQLGIYQIADAKGEILYIGQAGARSPFGLRSELQRELTERGAGCQFRVEVNMQYRSRWFELLMVHKADHGTLPPDNAKNPPPNLGRLSPA